MAPNHLPFHHLPLGHLTKKRAKVLLFFHIRKFLRIFFTLYVIFVQYR